MTSSSVYVRDLLCQARILTSAALSLINLFAEEATRLERQDEASRLRALHSSIRQQLEQAKGDEDTASYGYSRASLMLSLGGLAVSRTIKMISKNKQISAFSDHLFNSVVRKEPPFGRVLICIGPKGLPDDAGVISISRLARKSNRDESEVINELRGRGCLLFSEKVFSLLTDRLIGEVQEGRLRLPVSIEKLSQITASGELKLESKSLE